MPILVSLSTAVILSTCDSVLDVCKMRGDGCSDTLGGQPCKNFIAVGYTCSDLVFMGGCKECTCKPGTYDDDSAVVKGKCTGAVGVCYSGLSDNQRASVVDQHNLYRGIHGSCSVEYDVKLEEYALGSVGFATTCTTKSLTHNVDGAYGENLAYILRQNIDVHNYDPAIAVRAWYCEEENCFDYATSLPNGQGVTGHMTQVVWNSSLKIGCALCQAPGNPSSYTNIFTICSYSPPGNYPNGYATNVKPPGTTSQWCPANASISDDEATPSAGSRVYYTIMVWVVSAVVVSGVL